MARGGVEERGFVYARKTRRVMYYPRNVTQKICTLIGNSSHCLFVFPGETRRFGRWLRPDSDVAQSLRLIYLSVVQCVTELQPQFVRERDDGAPPLHY